MKMSFTLAAALCLVSAYAEPIISVEDKADLTRLIRSNMKDGIITIGSGGEIRSKKSFQVDPKAKYKVSADVRITAGKKTSILLGFGPLDNNGKQILPAFVCIRTKSATELAAPANKGDKVITVKNASGWDNRTPYGYAVLDVKEDLSDLPNRSGIRHVKGGVSAQDGVWTVKLQAPLQKDYPAGTKVRQQYDAGTYMYSKTFTKQTEDWTHIEGIASGFAACGNPGNKFWKGTKTAIVIVVVTGKDAAAEIKNLQAEEIK